MFGIQFSELKLSESIKGAVHFELGVRDFGDTKHDVGIRDNSKDGEIV